MDGRLRVLCLTNKLQVGGHECGRLTLAGFIDRRRFDYRFLTITETPDLDDDQLIAGSYLQPLFRSAGYPVESLGESNSRSDGTRGIGQLFGATAGMLRTVRRLVSYLRTHRIDVIDAHHTAAMFAAIVAGRLTGIPVVLTAYHIAPWQRPGMSLAGQITFRLAADIITDSQLRQQEISRWCHRRTLPVQVIPTGVTPPLPVTPAADMRRQIGIPDGATVIGMIAAFMEFKGHEDLLEAAIQICQQEQDVVFLCQGASRGQREYEQRLQRRIRESGLQNRFFLRTVSGEIGDIWQLIDIFAHPTRFDSLPLVVMEAMSLRKPAVVTDIGGIPEVVEHGQTGLIVPSRDVDQMAQALLRLIREPALADQFASAALQRYEETLAPEQMARRIEQVLIQAAGRRAESNDTAPICDAA